MKIGVIQASSQREKNAALYACTARAVERRGRGDEVINFGVFSGSDAAFSYVETAMCISLMLSSGAVDFVVTGCSSGQGMMLACNSLPGVLCGFVQTPQDAFLFGRINGGNAASVPLGLNYGWLGQINLQCVLDKLFEGDFGCGYPPEDAARKAADATLVKRLNATTKRDMAEAFARYDPDLMKRALSWREVREYILTHGTDGTVCGLIRRSVSDVE